MDNTNTHSLILKSRMNRFRDLSEMVNTIGIVMARSLWKLFAKATISKKDKEMKPWE